MSDSSLWLLVLIFVVFLRGCDSGTDVNIHQAIIYHLTDGKYGVTEGTQ